jgi:two-component system CheB/CheR fusion protein
VDKGQEGLPPAVVLNTRLGEREVNSVWLAPDSPRVPLRVLVVDDEPDTAASLTLLLQMWGHGVRTAADGPGALQAAHAYRPQVVLLDIGLPGLDGCEVARRLRRQSDGLVLIAMTGFGDSQTLRQIGEAGFDDCLLKPMDPEAVQQLLAGRYACN